MEPTRSAAAAHLDLSRDSRGPGGGSGEDPGGVKKTSDVKSGCQNHAGLKAA